MKAPVNPVGKGGQVARAVFGEIKRMVGSTETGFGVTQDRINGLAWRSAAGRTIG